MTKKGAEFMDQESGISDEVDKIIELYRKDVQRRRNEFKRIREEITEKWCNDYNITVDSETITKLAGNISIGPHLRTKVNKRKKDLIVDHFVEESLFIDKLLHFLSGPSNQKLLYMRRLKEHILLFKDDRNDVVKSLSKIKSMNGNAINRINSTRAGSRKELLLLLPKVLKALKGMDQHEQIMAIQKLFLQLGYTNRSGKNDPQSVYNDIAEMKTEIEVLEDQKK